MEIIHVSAECYPMAKAGGLADVVGALPKYQNKLGHIAKVVMPMHRTKFLYNNEWETVHKGSFPMGKFYFDFTVIKEKTNVLAQAAMKLGEALYKAQSANASADGEVPNVDKDEDDIVDADFTEVGDDDKKTS